MALTLLSLDTKYFRSPGFPFLRVPNSPGVVLAVPFWEKGCCPYSSSVVDSAIRGGGDEEESLEELVPEVARWTELHGA